jgi:gamma-glutamyl:cysteine ligase YbdK (ATP-grasp superfamily)
MGEEINFRHFDRHDFKNFEARLKDETELLESWFAQGRFREDQTVVGVELEAWLVDRDYSPAPRNEDFLQLVSSHLAVPELAKYNVELNATEQPLADRAFSSLHADLAGRWGACSRAAAAIDVGLLMIGIHPGAEEASLTLDTMSNMERYRALNEQVMRLRRGRDITLNITGRESLSLAHHDLTFESAATSFQVHLQVPASRAARVFNASVISSAPMVAAAANSPYLFGKDLWDETRIPLFEQTVSVEPSRVTFGSAYVEGSLLECFRENVEKFPLLLPVSFDDDPERMHHLRLHNGTIWRWNRPLIGFGEQGEPHLRIEHRVLPSGPTLTDCVANAAFYSGLALSLAGEEAPPEATLAFEEAKKNFYAAARDGLKAKVTWVDGRVRNLPSLLLQELLPRARETLEKHGADRSDVGRYLGVLEERVRSGRTGSVWQRSWVKKHGGNMRALTAAYLERQEGDVPVHEWEV